MSVPELLKYAKAFLNLKLTLLHETAGKATVYRVVFICRGLIEIVLILPSVMDDIVIDCFALDFLEICEYSLEMIVNFDCFLSVWKARVDNSKVRHFKNVVNSIFFTEEAAEGR